jgi:hypothetical protein
MFTHQLQLRRHSHEWFKRGFVLIALVLLCLAAPRPAAADVITDWNAIALTTVQAAFPGNPQQHSRAAAITQAAVFDAVNAIEPRYTVYAVSPPVTQPASQEAAAVAAGHGVLVRLFPSRKPSLDAQYAASLALIPDGDAKQNGIAVGEFVAAERWSPSEARTALSLSRTLCPRPASAYGDRPPRRRPPYHGGAASPPSYLRAQRSSTSHLRRS